MTESQNRKIVVSTEAIAKIRQSAQLLREAGAMLLRAGGPPGLIYLEAAKLDFIAQEMERICNAKISREN